MQKVHLSLLLVLLTAGSLISACAAPKVSETVKPCEVSLYEIRPIAMDEKAAAFQVTFLIRNPNQSMATLTELDYDLKNENDLVGTGGTNTEVYVPGRTKVKTAIAIGITNYNVVSRFMLQQTLPPAEAQTRAEALFARFKDEDGTWNLKGEAYFRSGSGPTVSIPFEGQYSVK